MYCCRCGIRATDSETICSNCGAALAVSNEDDLPAFASAALGPSAAEMSAQLASYGGFWRRLAGMLVDGALLFFPQAIFRVLLGLEVFPIIDSWDDGRVQLAQAASLLLAFTYGVFMESSRAQGTLGQQLLGLRVTDTQGHRISPARALARHLAKFVSMLLCGIGYLLQLWTARRQTLHDLIASCVIVRVREHDAPHPAPAGPYLAGPA